MPRTPLRLTLDTLHVVSFATDPGCVGRGTVFGLAQEPDDPPFNTVGDIPTCEPCEPSNQRTCDTCQGPNCREPDCRDETLA